MRKRVFFAKINFREWKKIKYFAGINFRELAKNFHQRQMFSRFFLSIVNRCWCPSRHFLEKKMSTFGCQASFSSRLILLPLPRKMIARRGCVPSGRNITCRLHCLLSSLLPGWLIQVLWSLAPGSTYSYVIFASITKGRGLWSTLRRSWGLNLPHFVSNESSFPNRTQRSRYVACHFWRSGTLSSLRLFLLRCLARIWMLYWRRKRTTTRDLITYSSHPMISLYKTRALVHTQWKFTLCPLDLAALNFTQSFS